MKPLRVSARQGRENLLKIRCAIYNIWPKNWGAQSQDFHYYWPKYWVWKCASCALDSLALVGSKPFKEAKSYPCSGFLSKCTVWIVAFCLRVFILPSRPQKSREILTKSLASLKLRDTDKGWCWLFSNRGQPMPNHLCDGRMMNSATSRCRFL